MTKNIYFLHKKKVDQKRKRQRGSSNTQMQKSNMLHIKHTENIINPQVSEVARLNHKDRYEEDAVQANQLSMLFNPFNKFVSAKSKSRQQINQTRKNSNKQKDISLKPVKQSLSIDLFAQNRIAKTIQVIKAKQKYQVWHNSSLLTNSFCQSISFNAGNSNRNSKLGRQNQKQSIFNFIQNGIKQSRKNRSKTQPVADGTDKVIFSIKKMQFNNSFGRQGKISQRSKNNFSIYKFYQRIRQPKHKTQAQAIEYCQNGSSNVFHKLSNYQKRKNQQKTKFFNLSPWDPQKQEMQ